MTKELRQHLDALKKLTPEMNRLADQATNAVRSVEESLAGLGLSVNANAEPNRWYGRSRLSLAYRRIGGKFRVAIVEEDLVQTGPREDDWEWQESGETPFLEARREQKLETITLLPDLLGDITSKAQALVEQATQAAAAINEIVASLK